MTYSAHHQKLCTSATCLGTITEPILPHLAVHDSFSIAPQQVLKQFCDVCHLLADGLSYSLIVFQVTPTKQSTILFSAASTHRDEEVGKERRVMGASLTTNVLALTDTLGIKRGFHVDADRKSSFFLPL